ncbi:unnamed protein product [Microthlaspi erraticum]|uniref:F-box associated beta-propeller type 3 domain-containing protein n=1 Tax=Microthlaspi erraticum TaxID=1685480 RepID=A0A6D2HXL3_9BRAS|nr:unnamed protein product [Microthlaspi erraticum]
MPFSFDLAVIFHRERRRTKSRPKVTGRRRREICKSHEALEEIPFDLVVEILMKSLMRFKSVSKLWSSFIRSQYFTNRFLKVPSSSVPRLYLWLEFEDSHRGNVLLSSSASTDSDGTRMSSFIVDQEVTIAAMKGYSFSHVYRGLMCFKKGPSAHIYNTTTRQLVVLPDIDESNIIAEDHKHKKILYHIGHDPVHDRYKVLCTVARTSNEVGDDITFLSEQWVLLLRGDGPSRWRKIPCPSPPHFPLTQGLAINGRMHYLAWVHVGDPVLVSFDISSEDMSILQVPEDDSFWPHRFNRLIEFGGRVALLDHSNVKSEGVMKLWVMEDAEKNNRWWSKTFVLQPSEMHIVSTHMVDNTSLRVHGTTRNGEVILVPQNVTHTRTGGRIYNPQNSTLFYVFLYDLQKNHIRKVEIKETSNRYLTRDWNVLGVDDVDNLMYL